MAEKAVRYEAKDDIALITLDRPDVLNAMNTQMRTELLEIFTRLKTDDAVKAVVVTGSGERAFCAGADIREFLEPPTPTHFREARRRVDFRAEMERCPQAIIAAIRGFALGGGLEFALACDIRIAAEDAQLGLTEINLAIIPGGGGTQRLPRLVGRGKALEMILTGMRVPAAEAARGHRELLRLDRRHRRLDQQVPCPVEADLQIVAGRGPAHLGAEQALDLPA